MVAVMREAQMEGARVALCSYWPALLACSGSGTFPRAPLRSCPLSRPVAQTQTSTIVLCDRQRKHYKARHKPCSSTTVTLQPSPSVLAFLLPHCISPGPAMALPKRIIKETERLMNEP